MDAQRNHKLERARRALEWLALGDAFGQTLFAPAFVIDPMFADRQNRFEGPWPYTDDAAMARAVYDELASNGAVEPSSLADRFTQEYGREPWRGYGGGMHRLFERRGAGVDWEVAAHMLFEGSGSYGNGAAMRVAPLGAYFADSDDTTLVAQARASALPTHTHREGVAGAIAVAVATAMMWRVRDCSDDEVARGLMFEAVLDLTPEGDVRSRISRASRMPSDAHPMSAAARLGNGSRITALDTVPLCLWSIGAHRRDFEHAMWQTASVLGDRDTTCAIVAGMLAMCAHPTSVPSEWIEHAECVFVSRLGG